VRKTESEIETNKTVISELLVGVNKD